MWTEQGMLHTHFAGFESLLEVEETTADDVKMVKAATRSGVAPGRS